MLDVLALTVSAIFTGAAIYINVVEHPARLTLDDASALAQWKLSYRRGYAMQATLAATAGLLGVAGWWRSGELLLLFGGLLMLANWPWTLLVIKPVNDRLKGSAPGSDGIRPLLRRWAVLHAVRSGLGGVATAILLIVATI